MKGINYNLDLIMNTSNRPEMSLPKVDDKKVVVELIRCSTCHGNKRTEEFLNIHGRRVRTCLHCRKIKSDWYQADRCHKLAIIKAGGVK